MGREAIIYDREDFLITDKVMNSWLKSVIPVPAISMNGTDYWGISMLFWSSVLLRFASLITIATGVAFPANFSWFAGNILTGLAIYFFVSFCYAYVTNFMLKRDPRIKYGYDQNELFIKSAKYGWFAKPMMVITMTGQHMMDQALNSLIVTKLDIPTMAGWEEIPTLTPWMLIVIYSAIMYIACRFTSTDTMDYYDYQFSKIVLVLLHTPLSRISFMWGFRPKKDNLFSAIMDKRAIVVCYGSELNAVLRTATYNFTCIEEAAKSIDGIIVIPDKPISQMAGEFLYSFFLDKYTLDPTIGIDTVASTFDAFVLAICYVTKSKNKPHIFLSEKVSGKDIGRINAGEPLPKKKRNLQDVMNERANTKSGLEGGET